MECVTNPDCDANTMFPDYETPEVITNWPASHFDFDGTNEYLAPFQDVNGDGLYDPTAGDYPGYDLNATGNCTENDYLFIFDFFISNFALQLSHSLATHAPFPIMLAQACSSGCLCSTLGVSEALLWSHLGYFGYCVKDPSPS